MTMQEVLARVSEVLDVELFHMGSTSLTIGTLLTAVLVVLLSFWLSWLIRRAILLFLKERSVPEQGSMAVTARLVHYTIIFLGFAIALGTLGIELTAVFAAGAVFAVAIGFAMQNITANFVSGVILLFERSIKPGDIVEVDGRIMRVLDMGVRSTIARGLNEEDLIIPNSMLVQATVKNFTFRDTLYRIDAEVGVSYGSDMERVREVLETMVQGLQWRSRKLESVVLMKGFGASSVDFMVSVFTDDPWSIRRLRSQVNEAIWAALKEAQIEIAFPHMDVHCDAPVVEALARQES